MLNTVSDIDLCSDGSIGWLLERQWSRDYFHEERREGGEVGGTLGGMLKKSRTPHLAFDEMQWWFLMQVPEGGVHLF